MSDYAKIRDVQMDNGTTITEQQVGSRRKLYAKGVLIATTTNTGVLNLGELSPKSFFSFLAMFRKCLYRQFEVNPSLFDLKIEYKGFSRGKKLEVWKQLSAGDVFYNIDLSSAYWQMAHKLGYIDSEMFNEYIRLDDYKQAKRYCVSFLARKSFSQRLDASTGELFRIECDNTAFEQAYNNIRNELYRSIDLAKKEAKGCLEFNIDGLSVMNTDVKPVMAKLKELGLIYKVSECRKINDSTYLKGGKLRKFKNI